MEKQAYVTMVVTSDYVTGALVMAHSLRNSGNASRPLLCIVTKDVESQDRATLQAVRAFPSWILVPSNVLSSRGLAAGLQLHALTVVLSDAQGGMACIEVDSMAAPSPSGVGEWDKV